MKIEEWLRKMEKFFQESIDRADKNLNFVLSGELRKARFHFRLGQFNQAVEHLKSAKILI